MAVKLVVFDMDGTTVEDKDFVASALVKAFEKQDLFIATKHANLKMGLPAVVAIRELAEDLFEETPDNLDQIVDAINKDYTEQLVEFYQSDSSVKGRLNAVRTMLALKNKDIQIALNTSFSREIADTIIDRLGWDVQSVIDFSVASDDVKNSRPAGDMILKAMELAGISDPKQVAKVGDTVADLQEGTSAGCQYVIGLTSGAQNREQLSKQKHTHLINDIYDVVDIVS